MGVRIGVMSDSHGDAYALKRAIKRMGDVDLIVHLGDYCRDAEILSKEIGRDIITVKGNCDISAKIECDSILNLEDKKILITHGHNYNVKSNYLSLYYKAAQESVDAVFFGHTHYAEIFENNNIIFFNPGSLNRPRGNRETFGIVVIENNMITPGIVQLY